MSAAAPRLADWTTLRVGGPAAHWLEAETDDDVRAAVLGGPDLLVLGSGSNLVAPDSGFGGTVLHMALRGIESARNGEFVDLRVRAGEAWDDLVELCVAEGWAGIEAMSGIPGLAGATPVQNVGAYGQELSSVVQRVRVLDTATAEITWLERDQCSFGYRSSRFKAEPGRHVVLDVALRLAVSASGRVAYAELAERLGVAVGGMAPVGAIREAVLELRRAKGMVLDEADHDTWSAGSFFTNPVVDARGAAGVDAGCPRYPAAGGEKLSAAWLIEQSGIERGFALPGSRAAVSGKHVLALTNRGGASAAEILELADFVAARVRGAHGIELVPEPVVLAG